MEIGQAAKLPSKQTPAPYLVPNKKAEEYKMTNSVLNSKIQKLAKLNQKAAELNEQIEALKTELKAEMTARCTDELVGGGFKVSWQKVNSSRFNSKEFQKDHADLYERYKEFSSSMRFTMSAATAPVASKAAAPLVKVA